MLRIEVFRQKFDTVKSTYIPEIILRTWCKVNQIFQIKIMRFLTKMILNFLTFRCKKFEYYLFIFTNIKRVIAGV